MILFVIPAARNERKLLYLGRGKRKNTQGTAVTDPLLLEDDQMKAASSSSSTATANSSQALDIEHLDWVRNWEQHTTTGYQTTLHLNRHSNEKCASPSKRGSVRVKAETVSSLPKYIVFEMNVMYVYLWAAFNFLLFFRADILTCNTYKTKRPVRRAWR